MKRRLRIYSTLFGIILAGLFALGGPADAQRQFSNFLTILGGNAGVTPSIRAQGTDTNISINLVPKGTGTVQVNGSAIIPASGGTFANLTVNPGPLNVTGTTNLTGPLFIQPGTATGLKLVGARIAHNITDVATTGLAIETLYTFSIAANTLAVNGESLRFTVYATTAANANAKVLDLVYGATTIGTFTANANNDLLRIVCDVFRTAAATQKAICMGDDGDLAAVAGNGGRGVVTTPAETLSGAVTVLVRGTTAAAIGDLTARAATIDWYPVGQ